MSTAELLGGPPSGNPASPAGPVGDPPANPAGNPPVNPANPAAPLWYDSIQDPAIKELMQQKRYDDPQSLATAYYHANRMISGDRVITLPGADAKPEDWDAIYTKMGRPAKADDYQFKFPDGTKPDENMVTFAKNMFHTLGLDPTRAQKGVDMWEAWAKEQTAKISDATTRQEAADLEALKQPFGQAWDGMIDAGKKAISALQLPPVVTDALDKSMGTPAVLQLMAEIGKRLGEGTFVPAQQGGDVTTPESMTPAQAKTRIETLRSDADFQARYNDKRNPRHKEAVEELQRLYARTTA